LTYREMVERIFLGLRKRPRIISLPPWLMMALIRLASILPQLRGVNPQMAKRQNTDLVFDDSKLKSLVNYEPREFQPDVSDFKTPATLEKFRL